MLYYFTASDKDAQEHFEKTIVNAYPIANDFERLDEQTKLILKQRGLDQYVHMWGATPGSSNISRWKKLSPGDKVLAYANKQFHYQGEIIAKIHNPILAKKVWGTRQVKGKPPETWEYIYFIDKLVPFNVEAKKFAAFFGYKINFTPQGFSNIQEDKLQIKLRRYGSIDQLIYALENEFILSDEETEEENFQNSLDGNYKNINIDQPEESKKRKEPRNVKGKLVWPRDPNESKKALKKAKFLCEVNASHTTFISEASAVNYTEAHHLIPMKMQHEFDINLDTVSNIVSLCPICHRAIHLAGPKMKKELLEGLFKLRIDALKRLGIVTSYQDLLGYYGVLK